ncbi:MAG: hypothetical protein WAM60_18755 [Candidatus Promineifilaceae bacterium]
MKRRIAIILVPTFVFIGILAALILNQFSNELPAEAQDVLDSYVAALPKEATVTSAVFARNSERFSAEMGRQIIHAPIEAYRTSPVLYDGDVIQPIEDNGDFALPPQEVWCITLDTTSKQTAEDYFLARYESLYGSTWVLYQSQDGRESAETIGCNSQ